MRDFQSIDVTTNILVIGNSKGDLIVFTFVEMGVIRVNTFEAAGLIGESFLNIGRIEEFNYQVKNSKNALAKFFSEQIRNLFVTTEYISGSYFCEINFMVNKRLFSTRQKLVRNIMSNVPTQITV